jgi:hypothetical protein
VALKAETADVGAVLSALHQAYYTMYAVLIRNGAIGRGEISALLRLPSTEQFIGAEAAQWLSGIADELGVIDDGRAPRFEVIEGGKPEE